MILLRYGRAIEYLGQRYRLEGALGSGGMADVCLAWDEHEEREVAIKVIKPDELDQRSLDRFLKEATQIARWQHPHILRVYGDVKFEVLDASQGCLVPYIVMEYAQGGDLHKRLHAGQPYPLNETLHVFSQICSAVAYAHDQGIIHRDIKPLNVLFRVLHDGSEQAVLSDFGLAVEVDATHFTFAGGGTLPYMAPEQLLGNAQPASDIFALGVMLYQLCTGRLPFRRTLQDLHRIGTGLDHEPPAPSSLNPMLPPALDDVILTALAQDPAQRFTHADLLWQSMLAAVGGQSQTRKRGRSQRSSGRPLELGQPSENEQPQRSRPSEGGRPLELGRSQGYAPTIRGANTRNWQLAGVGDEMEGMDRLAELPLEDAEHWAGQASQISPGVASPLAEVRKVSHQSHNTPDNEIASYSGTLHSAINEDIEERAASRKTRSIRSAIPRDTYLPPLDTGPSRPLPTPPIRQKQPPPVATSTMRHGPKPWLLIGLGFLLLIAVISGAGTLTFLAPISGSMLKNIPLSSQPTDATVTITPNKQVVHSTYTIQAVTGIADPNQQQVHMRLVTDVPTQQTGKATATGHNQTGATTAKGMLTFFNGSFNSSFTVPSGSNITSKSGIDVITDAPAVIPSANSTTGAQGTITISAHVAFAGTRGNIPAQDINETCCTTGNFVFVRNIAAFTGGQDGKAYTFLQQGDVDTVAKQLEGGMLTQGRNDWRNAQLQPNERLLKQPQCSYDVTTDSPIGDKGSNVASAQVSVTAKCTSFAYDQQATLELVEAQLQHRVNRTPGPGYVLVGNIQTQVSVQAMNQDNATLHVDARGVWAYNFSDQQKRALLQQITGKNQADAQATLRGQTGVQNVTIQAGGNTLPSNPAQISIVVQAVQGLQGGNTVSDASNTQ